MSKNCCDFGCTQSANCPVRRANSFPIVTGESLKAPPKARAPDRKDQALHLARWAALTVAAMACAVAVIAFFNK